MKKVKITVMRIVCHQDLMKLYENPIEDACNMHVGDVFIANGWQKPEGFCDSAWETISPFVMTLSHGGENFYNGWMKNPKSAMLSCNDGFRPVSFLIETIEKDQNTDQDQNTEKDQNTDQGQNTDQDQQTNINSLDVQKTVLYN